MILRTDATAATDFVMRLAVALHRAGVPANRVEPVLTEVSAHLRVPGTFLVTPTAIQASFEPAAATAAPTARGPDLVQRGRFVRVEPGSEDLGKLAALDRLARRVLEHPVDLDVAHRELDTIGSDPASTPTRDLLEVSAFAFTSGIAARCFGGGGHEMLAAVVGGGVIGTLLRWARAHPGVAPIFEGLAAFVIALLVFGVPIAVGSAWFAPDVVLLASLIVLLPGLRLTTAVTEIATGHLISGVARMAATAVSFGLLGFGVLLAKRCVEVLAVPSRGAAPAAFGSFTNTAAGLPDWTLWLACALAPIGFAGILRTARRDLLATILVAPLGFFAARAAGLTLGPDIGAFVGAAAVTAASNLVARWRRRPACITSVPGILMLVPGALGFRSFESLMTRGDAVLGIESAAQMVTVVTGLVAGMLVANVVTPARRVL